MQIDWWTLGFQTINFLVVVWLLSRFLYRPVRRIIEEREAADRKLAEEAQTKAEAADQARKEYEDKLADFAETRRRREAELHSAMEKEKEATLKEAREKADKLMSETRDKLAREREESLNDLKSDIASLATRLARTALSSGVSPDAALKQVKDHLDGLPAQELAELKGDASGLDARIRVVTATVLDDEEQTEWRSAVSERLGDGLDIAFAQDPEILGGAELHFPHAVLNLSVARRLQDATDTIMA